MKTQKNTRWSLVRKVCVAGMLVILWILAQIGLAVWFIGGPYFPSPSMKQIARVIGIYLPFIISLVIFGKIVMSSPIVPFWFVPAAGVLSLMYFFASAYYRHIPALMIAAAMAFIAYEMNKDLRRSA